MEDEEGGRNIEGSRKKGREGYREGGGREVGRGWGGEGWRKQDQAKRGGGRETNLHNYLPGTMIWMECWTFWYWTQSTNPQSIANGNQTIVSAALLTTPTGMAP